MNTPDRVVLGARGSERALSIDAFLKIPVDEQLELLFRGEVSFFSGQIPVRALEALKLLRQQRAVPAPAR